MVTSIAHRLWDLTPWASLRTGGGDGQKVADDLRMLLYASPEDDDGSYERLENELESQGRLFECAASAVGVIVASVADGSVPPPNLAPSLDVLGRILAGYPDDSEVAAGNGDLREQCLSEAMKGYWSLVKTASERDQFNAWRVARAVLDLLDPERTKRILD